MDRRARSALNKALNASLLESDHVLVDEARLQKLLLAAVARAMVREEFTIMVNQEFQDVLERQGLAQFSTPSYAIGVSSLGITSKRTFVFDLYGPGVGGSQRMTLEVK